MARDEGRSQNAIRPLDYESGLLQRADGSARVCMGNTCVIAGVFGPGDVEQRREIPDRATVVVHIKPLSGLDGPMERENEQILHDLLAQIINITSHPRTLISISLQIVCDDGSLLSTMINASIAALVDAGISMKTLVFSSTCSWSSNSFLLDPTKKEEAKADSIITAAFETNSDVVGGISMVKTAGIISKDDLIKAISSCKLASNAIAHFFRLSISRMCGISSNQTPEAMNQ